MTRSLITSVEIENTGDEDRVRVWNRGRLAGALMVRAGDGFALAEYLMLINSASFRRTVEATGAIRLIDTGENE